MKNRIVHIILMVLLVSTAFAQTEMQTIDSLKQAIASQKGREKVETMLELSNVFLDFSPDDCINTCERVIALADEYSEIKAEAYWNMAVCYNNNDDLDLSRDYYSKAIELFQNTSNANSLIKVSVDLAYTEMMMGDMQSSIDTYLNIISICDEIDDGLMKANVLNDLSFAYYQVGDMEKSIDCLFRARVLYEMFDDELSVAQCENNIGSIYIETSKYVEALKLFRKIIPVLDYHDESISLAHVYNNLGALYKDGLVKYDSAIIMFEKSMKYCEMSFDSIIMVDNKIGVADVFFAEGKYEQAAEVYEFALEQSEKLRYYDGQMKAFSGLGILYCKSGEYKKSLEFIQAGLELEKKRSTSVFRPIIRQSLIMDYAQLGRLDEMKAELQKMSDEYDAALGENDSYINENRHLKINAEELSQLYEAMSTLSESQNRQVRAYRLAFFGLLAIVLSVSFALLLRHLRKKR